MDWLLRVALAHVARGNLQLTTARGTTLAFGDGTGPPIAARFTSKAAQWAVLLDPDLKLGEAYMDGTFVMERGSIAQFVDLVAEKTAWPRWAAPITALRFAWRRIKQLNVRTRARRNVAHHYDLDHRLYALFLDSDRQYSCAYFETPPESLDDAQLAKKRHLAAKLLLENGHRMLDIGCGWGGLALYAAGLLRRRGHRHHAVAGAARGAASARAERGSRRPRRLRGARLSRPSPAPSTASSFGRHVGACRRPTFYDAFFKAGCTASTSSSRGRQGHGKPHFRSGDRAARGATPMRGR